MVEKFLILILILILQMCQVLIVFHRWFRRTMNLNFHTYQLYFSINWTLSEGILFSRVVWSLINGPYIVGPFFFYFCVIDSLAWFCMGSPCKNSQLMLVFLNLGPTSFQLCIDNLPDNAISNIGICADNTTVSGSWIHFLKNSTCLIWHFK